MMNLTAPIRIEKNADKKAPAEPDYRIFAGDVETEIGGGWIAQAKSSGREYISLTLADPQIGPRKIYANLAPVKGKKGRVRAALESEGVTLSVTALAGAVTFWSCSCGARTRCGCPALNRMGLELSVFAA